MLRFPWVDLISAAVRSDRYWGANPSGPFVTDNKSPRTERLALVSIMTQAAMGHNGGLYTDFSPQHSYDNTHALVY